MMTREQVVHEIERLRGVYGRALPVNEHTIDGWHDVLHKSRPDLVARAVSRWMADERNAPRPAEIREAAQALAMVSGPERKELERGTCELCEGSGFEFVDTEGHGSVKRCRRGCQPPPPSSGRQPVERGRADNREWVRRIRAARVEHQAHVREVGEDAYLRERGLDPARFRMERGMILARVGAPPVEEDEEIF